MDQKDYSAILKKRKAKVDWRNRFSVRLYNEFERRLRELYLHQQEVKFKR